MKKVISQSERLAMIGLYHLANSYYAKVRNYERELSKMLGDASEFNDQVSEAIYANYEGREPPFDAVLARLGIKVKQPPAKRRTR